jgi:hypothetical protein
MGELSSEQAVQVCETTEAFQARELSAEERKRYACNVAGAAAGALAADMRRSYEEACEEFRAECLSDASCDATIAQYEACQRDTVQSTRDYNASFSCAPPDDGDASSEEAASPCAIYLESCYGS